jgi:hypothetical protein
MFSLSMQARSGVIRGSRKLPVLIVTHCHLRLLRREPDEAVVELRAKLAYWREWLSDIDEIL